jgi:ribonuclease J
MYIINEIIGLAIKNHKRLVLTNPHFIDVLPQFMANGDLIIPRANQCTVDEMNQYAPSDLIILITGQGEELYNYLEDLGRGENKDKNLKIMPNDVIVLACPPVPMTEIKATDAIDALYLSGAKIINLTHKELSSMHAQEEDLKMLISLFHPKYYMPVEGEFRLMMANAKVAKSIGYSVDNIFLIDNGMSLGFDAAGNAVLPISQYVKPGNTFIDGLGIGDVRSNIIDERTKMSENGAIVLGAIVSLKNRKLLSKPQIEMRGYVQLKDSETIIKQVTTIFNNCLNELLTAVNPDIKISSDKLEQILSSELKKASGKDPQIIPRIINADLN